MSRANVTLDDLYLYELGYYKDSMDKKIKRLTKDTQKVVKQEKSLLKADKKNDKIVDKAKAKMKAKC
jgi:hypothetical protein